MRDLMIGRPMPLAKYQTRRQPRGAEDRVDETSAVAVTVASRPKCSCGNDAEYIAKEERYARCFRCALRERSRLGVIFDLILTDEDFHETEGDVS